MTATPKSTPQPPVWIEIKAPNFHAQWKITPDKLNDFLAFASKCILAEHTETASAPKDIKENQ